jgi:hypothetical protein
LNKKKEKSLPFYKAFQDHGAPTDKEFKGYEVPLLSALFERTFEGVKGHGVFLHEDFIEDFYEKILLHEEELTTEVSFQALTDSLQRPRTMTVKKRKHKKDIQVPDGVAIGFCKALACGLLCIIPTGITQTIGTGLVLSGVNNMIQHAKDPINDSSENWEQDLDHRQKMNHENVSQTLPERVSSRLHGITQV